MNNKLEKLIMVCAIGIIVIIGISILSKFNIGIPCIFYEITHLHCPGCGMSRAIISISKLDFYQAFRYNALIVLLPVFFGIYVYDDILCQKKKIPQIVWVILLIIVILYGILRNITVFRFLAPTTIG